MAENTGDINTNNVNNTPLYSKPDSIIVNAAASTQPSDNSPQVKAQTDLTNINIILQDLNSIKEQIAKLPLNPLQLSYFQNSVYPLLYTIEYLSTTSLNLASSANYLSTSIVTHAKDSKIRDTLHLVYTMNADCEDIYRILHKRIDTLLCLEEKK